MARNGSGTYTKVNTFVSGASITASGHNQNWDDLALEMTNSVAVDGQSTMTAGLKGANGTNSLPAFTFGSDTNTGMYRIGADNLGLAVGGTKIVDITTSGVTITGTLTASITGIDLHGSTALTAPAVDDEMFIYDLSATANKRITFSDYFKVINSLTADASPDTASDYVVTYDASASGPKKVLLQSLPGRLPRGYIDGCTISNGTDATNDINIAAGVCRDSTNTVDITVAAMSGKQLDANWAAGATTGMRNSGAGIADGTYHIYAVAKADGTQDIYAHTSATVATVITALQAESGGASYLYARTIGSIVRASSAIVAFIQSGNTFWLTDPVLNYNATPANTNAFTVGITSPGGVKTEAIVNLQTDAQAVYVSSLDVTDLAASITASPLGMAGSSGSGNLGQARVMTNTSSQVRMRVTGTSPTRLVTLGWVHPRGQNA